MYRFVLNKLMRKSTQFLATFNNPKKNNLRILRIVTLKQKYDKHPI